MAQTGEMTFWDHLEELRGSLFRMLAVFGIAVVVLFFFKTFLFDNVILAPSKSDFFLYRLLGADFSLTLVNIEVAAQFMIHMKITFICALIVTFPYLIFEIWRFIAPALYKKEKKAVRGAFLFASVLFYAGVAVGYSIVFPLMLNFFSGYQVSPDVPNTFSLTSYISMFTSMVLIFGIVFEFPTVSVVLSSLGIITKETLKTFRRHAICAVLILAAVITPSGDPFSLMIVSVPLYLLYEFSILLCRKGENVENIEE
ncbi:MAG: twin-arginine translocase subunit TatC [Bacteroidales bacterium]|nr:twin-arginine translocase subunit TatC [Bacteroidales bacterium]